MSQGPSPLPDDPGVERPAELPPVPAKGILLKKRQPTPEAAAAAVRDKICARCGLPFRLDPGKKFFLCPDCYRREVAYKRKGATTRVMALITCIQCGKAEYLPFTPDDPKASRCRDCFREHKPEPKASEPHR
jgi:CxxC-x17-CxxC domain-containing protein